MTDKLKDIREGDTVEVTFRGVLGCVDFQAANITMHGAKDENSIWMEAFDSPHFSIKKVEKPLESGDMVTWGSKKAAYELVAIRGETAIVWGPSDIPEDERWADSLAYSRLGRVS